MRVSAWHDGGGTYGIRVGRGNRDAFFDPTWSMIEVEMDEDIQCFHLTPGFWNDCPEFRDRGVPLIRDWLRRHRTLPWEKGHPPRAELVPLGGGRFRLVP